MHFSVRIGCQSSRHKFYKIRKVSCSNKLHETFLWYPNFDPRFHFDLCKLYVIVYFPLYSNNFYKC